MLLRSLTIAMVSPVIDVVHKSSAHTTVPDIPRTIINGLYRLKSVIRNTIISWASWLYVEIGSTSRSTSSLVILRHSPAKYSNINGSDGRISFKKPKIHSNADSFIQVSIVLVTVEPLITQHWFKSSYPSCSHEMWSTSPEQSTLPQYGS